MPSYVNVKAAKAQKAQKDEKAITRDKLIVHAAERSFAVAAQTFQAIALKAMELQSQENCAVIAAIASEEKVAEVVMDSNSKTLKVFAGFERLTSKAMDIYAAEKGLQAVDSDDDDDDDDDYIEIE